MAKSAKLAKCSEISEVPRQGGSLSGRFARAPRVLQPLDERPGVARGVLRGWALSDKIPDLRFILNYSRFALYFKIKIPDLRFILKYLRDRIPDLRFILE